MTEGKNNVAVSRENSFKYIDIYSHWTTISIHNVCFKYTKHGNHLRFGSSG